MSEGSAIPAAVLWDMDGTLVDTEPYWIACEYELVAEHGGAWSEDHAHAIVGMDLRDAAAYIRDHGPVDMAVDDIVNRLLDGVTLKVRGSVPWRPGARELLADLRARGVRCALVTMSWRRFADAVVDALPVDSFDVIVAGDEVANGKPDPEPYATAAAAARRGRPGLRGDRGLAHRHQLGGRRRLPRGGGAQRRRGRCGPGVHDHADARRAGRRRAHRPRPAERFEIGRAGAHISHRARDRGRRRFEIGRAGAHISHRGESGAVDRHRRGGRRPARRCGRHRRHPRRIGCAAATARHPDRRLVAVLGARCGRAEHRRARHDAARGVAVLVPGHRGDDDRRGSERPVRRPLRS